MDLITAFGTAVFGIAGIAATTATSAMGFWDYIVLPLGAIFKFCYTILPNFSLAVLLFAIIFKAVLFPLDINRQRSQAKMVRFQPKINAIQKKYAADKQRQNEEIQKLYTEEGYNPMGGCLPSLLPLPIFLGLYRVIVRPLSFLGGSLLNIGARAAQVVQDVTILKSHVTIPGISVYNQELYLFRYLKSNPEWFTGSGLVEPASHLDMSLLGLFKNLDLSLGVGQEGAGWVYWIFPVLTVLASVVSAYYMGQINKKNNEGMAGANAASNPLMTIGMPLLTGVITYKFPACVLLYWIYNSLLMLGTTLVLNKFWPMSKMVAEYEAKLEKMRLAGKPVTKASKFREKLARAQKQTEEKQVRYDEYLEKSKSQKKELERRLIAKAREEELAKQGEVYEEKIDPKARGLMEKQMEKDLRKAEKEKAKDTYVPNAEARAAYIRMMESKKRGKK
ncbi:MAG TPA: membrane protein insertase YidC [Oscillospiraceae bacterium]|nr:membrane protein insertase YidC [Oscillospiraceae bacterium]HPS34743.1 membrane protein insertase YidC [Oscillospiraceae bacterium]